MSVTVILHSHHHSLTPKQRSRVHALTGQYLRYVRSASFLWWMHHHFTRSSVTCITGHHSFPVNVKILFQNIKGIWYNKSFHSQSELFHIMWQFFDSLLNVAVRFNSRMKETPFWNNFSFAEGKWKSLSYLVLNPLTFRSLTTYTGCHRRDGPNVSRVFLMLNYTDITQNTYVPSWTVIEIMAK